MSSCSNTCGVGATAPMRPVSIKHGQLAAGDGRPALVKDQHARARDKGHTRASPVHLAVGQRRGMGRAFQRWDVAILWQAGQSSLVEGLCTQHPVMHPPTGVGWTERQAQGAD